MKLPKPILEKYHYLPSSRINNARQLFLSGFTRARGNEAKELYFAEKWGLNYHGKYMGDSRPRDVEDSGLSEEESLLQAFEHNIY